MTYWNVNSANFAIQALAVLASMLDTGFWLVL